MSSHTPPGEHPLPWHVKDGSVFDSNKRMVKGDEARAFTCMACNSHVDLVTALERCRDNFIRAVEGKPVRDMAETLAEVDAALLAAQPTQETKNAG